MFFEFEQNKLYFETSGKKGIPTIFLHGWGGSCDSFRGAVNYLSAKNRLCLNLDFFGFGKSDVPNAVYGIDDYAAAIKELIMSQNYSKVNIVAHSFGGRVAIALAAKYPHFVEKLVLCDSAGLKPKRGLKYRLKIRAYKKAKKKGKDLSGYGSADYKQLSEKMREIFVKVVNCDQKNLLTDIRCDTLLIWRRKDKDTPMYMAKKMKKYIHKSGLIVFENAGHFSYIDEFDRFCRILNYFLT